MKCQRSVAHVCQKHICRQASSLTFYFRTASVSVFFLADASVRAPWWRRPAMQVCLLSFINKIHLSFRKQRPENKKERKCNFKGFFFFYSLQKITSGCNNTPHYANLKHVMAYPVVLEISLEDCQWKYVVPMEMQLCGQIFQENIFKRF